MTQALTLPDYFAVIGGALSALVTGAWAVGKILYGYKVKYAELEKANYQRALDQMDSEIKKLSGVVDNLSTRLENSLKEFTSQMHTMNLNVIQSAGQFEKSIATTREGFIREVSNLAERLALLTSVAGKLEEKYLGEGMYRLESKKPKG